MNFFHGCTALITGASSGLGREFASQLAPHASALILVARRLDRLEKLKAELARPGLAVHCHAVDLADEAQTDAFLAALGATSGVTLLINNAGVGDHGFFDDSEWPRVRAMFEVNIKALTRLTYALLPEFVRRGRGAILNVSSIVSLFPLPRMTVYAASKAYVTSFTEGLRAELRDTGVTVTAVCPGPVETEFFGFAERPNSTDPMPTPEIFKVSPAQVVAEALKAVADDRARVVPGWLLCILMALLSTVPIFLLRLFLRQRRARA